MIITQTITIDIEENTSKLEVYTLDGQLFLTEKINNQITLNLPSGIYLVRVNSTTKRVVIL